MGSGITREPVQLHQSGTLQRAIVAEQPESLVADAFPTALRAAIQASGLSLDRIQYRLRSRGVSVSVTALSYWQSGRRRPERAESLAALGHLESVLGVAPGSLMALLGPPRPRGRANRESNRLPIEALWTKSEQVSNLLKRIDFTTEAALTRISQQDVMELAADQGEKRISVRQVLRAERDGAERTLCVYDLERPGRPFPEITASQGCHIGRVAHDHAAGIVAAEILLEQPLHRGETVILDYSLTHPGPPYSRGDDSYCRKFTTPVREFVLELRFDPRMLPRYCEQYTTDPDNQITSRRRVEVNAEGHGHAVALDFGPGIFCVRWEWGDARITH
jgi:transcriptional regulator with XRE-family HTH domain